MKDDDGKPTGHFYFDRDAALAASTEVVRTHFFSEQAKIDLFLKERFDETWEHFDVNKDKLVEVERMPRFLRYLLGNSLEIGLQ